MTSTMSNPTEGLKEGPGELELDEQIGQDKQQAQAEALPDSTLDPEPEEDVDMIKMTTETGGNKVNGIFEWDLSELKEDQQGNILLESMDRPPAASSEPTTTGSERDITTSKGLTETGQQADSAGDELSTGFRRGSGSHLILTHQDENGNFLEDRVDELPDPEECPETQGDTVPEEVVGSFDQDGRSSAQTKLTNDEMVKWMNFEEHYLGPAPQGPSSSFVVEDGESGEVEADADASSAFQVTVHSFGTTIDLAGGCKTPSSTGTPPPPPESLPEPMAPKRAPPPVVAAPTKVTIAKTPQPAKQTNGTGGASKAPAVPATKPASGAAVSKKPSSTTTAPVKPSVSNTATAKPSVSSTATTSVKPSVTKMPTSPVKGSVAAASPARATGAVGSPARPASRRASAPQTPTTPGEDANKKVPMNKVKVGTVPSPNLKEVKSKIGSLPSATGSGITRKPVAAVGGDPAAAPKPAVKIPEQKLAWKAESKVGSFNTGYVRKVGNVKIESKKVEIKEVTSKVGSFNVAYKPGGGEKKIFDDKEYLKKTHSNSSSDHGGSAPHTPRPSSSATNGAVVPPATTSTGADGLGNAAPPAEEQKLIDA